MESTNQPHLLPSINEYITRGVQKTHIVDTLYLEK